MHDSADKPHGYLCGRSFTSISDEVVILSAGRTGACCCAERSSNLSGRMCSFRGSETG